MCVFCVYVYVFVLFVLMLQQKCPSAPNKDKRYCDKSSVSLNVIFALAAASH